MVHLKLFNLHLVFLLGLLEFNVIMLIKFLILLDVSLLDFFLALLVLEHQLLVLHVELLLLKLLNSVLCHFSLNISAILFAGSSM